MDDPSSRLHAIAHCAHHVPHLAALGPTTGAEVRRRQSGIRYDLPPIARLAA